ncbi:MAG: glutamate formimidoyltransferase [Firmicutes bacterium]|nr:glutamate formimidoyltransferase [Candidatus Fermentithermobacillaceae bacterium]
MKPLVECVPNFSEGRNPAVVAEIVSSIKSVPGVTVLDFSSDPSHNRSVVTFAGEPDAVEEAAFRAVKRASELIDMEKHTGEHPRIGATDVVPFVPVQGVTMDYCVQMARRVGKRIGDELQIPVYLYANAATRPDRVRLPDVRRGEYEGLKTAIVEDPSRYPDFGPPRLHPKAGATAVGARPPLIAFNVNLDTPDVQIARAIARKIRESSGGLPRVQAKGVFIAELGVAQVTMNLLDYTVTPIHVVFDKIVEEARQYGVGIRNSELIGLCPLDALLDVAMHAIKLTDFSRKRVLDLAILEAAKAGDLSAQESAAATTIPLEPGTAERGRVRTGEDVVTSKTRSLDERRTGMTDLSQFIQDLRAPTGAPGGGAASAVAGALGCALLEMVSGLTLSLPRFTEGRDRLAEIRSTAAQFEAAFRDLTAADTDAYLQVEKAMKLPKNTPEEKAARKEAMQQAFKEATKVPLDVATRAVEALELVPDLLKYGNPNAITDVAVGATFLETAFRGARMNAEINLSSIKDEEFARSCRDTLVALGARTEAVLSVLKTHLAQAGLSG